MEGKLRIVVCALMGLYDRGSAGCSLICAAWSGLGLWGVENTRHISDYYMDLRASDILADIGCDTYRESSR